MKILLIQPPIQDYYDTDIRLQPIGLAYLKACLQVHHPDVQCKIVDFHQGHGRFPVPIPKELKYLKNYYQYPDKSPFRVFYQYFHFGLDFGSIAEAIKVERPDVIGISSLFTPYFREAREVAKIAKELFPNVPVVMGGSHVNACPKEVLECPEVDFIITGEGERPIVEFLEALKGTRLLDEVSNLGFKRGEQQIFTAKKENFDLETIPFPELNDFKLENYLYGKKPLCFVITSRSCPHKCSFCSVHQTFGNTYRVRSVDNVLAEIKLRYRQGFRIIDFEDDNLTFYKDQMKDLCRKLIAEFPAGEMEFVAMNGISYISLDDELLELMKKAGFTHLNLALVTSDQFVRQATKRPHTISKYLEVVAKAKSLDLNIVSYQILGLPNESLDSMIQTLAFAARLPILQGASLFYLTPNSPIAKDFSYRTEADRFLARLTSMHIETDSFKRKDLFTLFICTRILDFLKSFSPERETNLVSLLETRGDDAQVARGVRLLRLLLSEKKLYADIGKELKPIEHFDFELFEKVIRQTEFVKPIKGEKIFLNFLD